ncbi:OLC1v1032244C2 [Oldenlandia corymbosa var. corymbosa]|uniref:cysteine--tRNA ligase n=1 Tax=Oldenlandia corymbosa var. corymbosa TaxID=529605 RepID=A0AAV1CKR9_OLDCO|nr:OLC1v1032244C2 [Oldenlandia corymbosa var. corymbosa]
MAEPSKVEFQLYNSMTKQKEIFRPKEEGKVGMYVCGVTAYDYSHIGHARAYVSFDVLYRYLKHLGYEVVYVRNFTDVDDKIIKRANENRDKESANEFREDALSLSARFCLEFQKDMDALQCLHPTHEPRVSDHIEDIKQMISQIIDNGCAYIVDGDVYFSIDNFPNYGVLSRRNLVDNRAGERVAVDSRKRNPADFALWKAAKPEEPSWESPWGPGRPGWHIECSAMSARYLTHSFDIHGGGMDLIFPHHENEIAQSCAACSESNVRYWVHNGFVTVDDEKMSKSLGNFFTIRKVTDEYHPLALRYFLLGMHYRSPVNYSILQINKASDSLFYIYQTLEKCETVLREFQEKKVATDYLDAKVSRSAQECLENLRREFDIKMADDLHAHVIVTGALADALKVMNSSSDDLQKNLRKKQIPKQLKLGPVQPLEELEKEVRKVLNILGLLSDSMYSEVLMQLKEKALQRAGMREEDVLLKIKERAELRKAKKFEEGDKIRSELTAKGIALMDEGKETIWRPCVPPEEEPVQKELKTALVEPVQSLALTDQEHKSTPPAS